MTTPTSLPATPTATTAPTMLPATRPVSAPSTRPILSPLARTIDQALIDLASGRKVDLAGLSPADRRVAEVLVGGLDNYRRSLRLGGGEAGLASLVELADRIRELAPLSVRKLSLASRVDGYGDYDPLPAILPAGRESSVVVYSEIAGFASRIGDRGQWETRLTQDIELINSQDEIAWSERGKAVVDNWPSHRRAFYIARVVRLPARLAAGRYTLRVTVADRLADRRASAVLPLTLVMPTPPSAGNDPAPMPQ